MTLQVALLGKDGFVIASDTKLVQIDGVRSSSTTSKISCYPDCGLVYAWSGPDTVALMAGQLLSKELKKPDRASLVPGEIEDLLMEVGKRAYQVHYGSASDIPRAQIQARRQLIVGVSTQQESKLWLLDIFSEPDCFPVLDKISAGDRENPALFFLEHYYGDETRPVKELVFLAAHTVLMAARLNPATVEGLEIVLCEAGAIRRISTEESAEEIASLKRRSSELDESMRANLLHRSDVDRA